MLNAYFANLINKASLHLVWITLFLVSCVKGPIESTLTSPEGDFTFTVKLNEEKYPVYSVEYKGTRVIGDSKLGFNLNRNLSKGVINIKELSRESYSGTWNPVYGERSEYPDHYNESVFAFTGFGLPINLRVRAYEEGNFRRLILH